MKDRVPLYPGRVKMVPVAGQENTYDMSRADSPQQEGTPLNKATLLSDETAALIWPDASTRPADPTVDDALALIESGDCIVNSIHGCEPRLFLRNLHRIADRIDPKNPKWADRDRFVLSKGHTAPGRWR